MSPAAARGLAAVLYADNFEKHYGHPAQHSDLYEQGFGRGEISMLSLILDLTLNPSPIEENDPLPVWFIEWANHIKKNREKFLTKLR